MIRHGDAALQLTFGECRKLERVLQSLMGKDRQAAYLRVYAAGDAMFFSELQSQLRCVNLEYEARLR